MWWIVLAGCRTPPPAPEGLTDSLRYLLRNFHEDDDTVAAGLSGLLHWFETDGDALLDAKADVDNVGAFTLEDLQRSDVARFDVEGSPNPADAPGVVSVGEMGCPLARTQELLVRGDQDVVFGSPWQAYDRTFVTPRGAFEAAALDALAPIRDPIPEEDLESHPDALLWTTNVVDSAKLGFTMRFDLDLRFRHGTYALEDGEPVEALLAAGFFPHAAEADSGGHAIRQSWSIEADVARPGGRTLRVFGVWSELDSALLAADSPMVLATGVNESQATAERMTQICAGDRTIPAE